MTAVADALLCRIARVAITVKMLRCAQYDSDTRFVILIFIYGSAACGMEIHPLRLTTKGRFIA